MATVSIKWLVTFRRGHLPELHTNISRCHNLNEGRHLSLFTGLLVFLRYRFVIELIGTLFVHYSLFPLQKQNPEIPLLLCRWSGILHKARITVWAMLHHDLLQTFSKLFHFRAAAVGRIFSQWGKVEIVVAAREIQGARGILKYCMGAGESEKERSFLFTRNKAAVMQVRRERNLRSLASCLWKHVR